LHDVIRDSCFVLCALLWKEKVLRWRLRWMQVKC
jgi:hypothetical protein